MAPFRTTLLACSLAFAGALAAQDAPLPPPGQPEHRARFERLAEELQLTPEQQARLRDSRDEDRRARLVEILTPEQQARLRALRAERSAARERRRDGLARLREELVVPELARIRGGFDAELSDDERERIAALREEVRARFGDLRPLRGHPAGPRAHRGDRPGAAAADHASFRAFLDEHAAQRADMRDIAARHRESLTAWREELAQLSATYRARAAELRGDGAGHERLREGAPARGGHEHDRRHAHPRQRGGGHHRGELLFLLLDPEAVDPRLVGPEDGDEGPRLRAYPNPATDRTRVSFEVRQAGPVTVALVAADGAAREVYSGQLPAGPQELDIELPAAAGAGKVVVRVTDAAGARSLVVSRH